MTTLTEPGVAAALDVARALVQSGIPVFAAPPAPGTKIGFRLPSRWQQTVAELSRVEEWQPGWALCMTCGCGLDVIDIDTYAGGSTKHLNDMLPHIYGMASTASGGTHLFVASLNVRSKNSLFPGVDIKGTSKDEVAGSCSWRRP